jgi:5'-phosphate synthase pdxT subunit
MKVGVLAVQGDFEAHRKMLEALGAETCEVRTPADLEGLDAIVLPGGESTTHVKLLEEEGLAAALTDFARRGGAIFGTCAGAILMAREVRNPAQRSLGLLDIVVQRNAYGRQVNSDVRLGICSLKETPLEMVFIRAPVIERVGSGVEVLAEEGGRPVLVRQGRLLASTFHPELTSDTTVHRYFLDIARQTARAA